MWFLLLIPLVCGLYLFCLFPAVRKHPDRALLEGKLIAHRGLHDTKVPENSLAAFRAAVREGFPIETDLHITADGEVVVFHDDSLARMCGIDRAPEELTLAKLKELRLAGTDERIPTLAEVLAEVDGRVPLLIEFKCVTRPVCERLCPAADAVLSSYRGAYLVQSFYPFVLSWYRKNRPDVCRGQLAAALRGEGIARRLLGAMAFDFIARPDFVSYDHTAAKAFGFRLCVKLGAMPVGWTFRSDDEIEQDRDDFAAYIFEGFLPARK